MSALKAKILMVMGSIKSLWKKIDMLVNKLAIISGALGAIASSIGKLALSPVSPVPSKIHSYCHIFLNRYYRENDVWICPYVSLGTRVVCFLCMIGVNLLMVSSFLDGMNESGSVVGTALSTAANFSFSVSCWREYEISYSLVASHHHFYDSHTNICEL